ncbi:MAG: TolC family protein [Bacteroidetes bacterium]|uniref:TolC family protein n=1 Tax=Phnomibacter sp. TaxID=2836217 RepID=UPI002FDDBD8F|nr:TolC family protein [Bacteroidota bacterium]
MMWSATAQNVLTLNDAIQQALSKNFDLQIARNDEDVATLLNNWSNAGRLPTVSAAAGYNFSNNNLDQRLSNGTNIKRNGASFQSENASVVAQWRVFNGFRVVAAKSRLDEQQKIANLNVRQQANVLVYNVISSYINLLRFQAQQKANQETLLLFEERMKLAENRFNIGVAGKSDYLQAAADYNAAKTNIMTIENNIEQEKVRLNNILSRNPSEAFTTSDASMTDVSFDDRDKILAAIDTLNPSMLMARSQLAVLYQQQREINANRLPTVTLNAGAGLNNSVNSAGFTLRNTTYGPNAGIQLAIPIFQGGVVKQNLKVNAVQQKSQQVQIESLRNDLMTALAAAYNNYKNAKKLYDLELQTLEVIKENNVIAMERFRKASITSVELRQTQINLIESQTRMINARYQMKQAEADVMLVMGKLVE